MLNDSYHSSSTSRRKVSKSHPAFQVKGSTTCISDTRIYIVSPYTAYEHILIDTRTSVLALSKRNSNAAEIIIFLHRLTQVLVEYFKELEEESIRDNFVIIYELMDEMMDFGYPQTTESKILQEYITQESHKLEIQVRPPMAVTNAVSWRTEGIRYRKNEVFLDVIESVNMLVRCHLFRSASLMTITTEIRSTPTETS